MSEEKKELDQGGPVEGTAGEEKAAEKQSERLENSVYDWARSLIAAVVGVVLLFTFSPGSSASVVHPCRILCIPETGSWCSIPCSVTSSPEMWWW